VQDDPLSNYSFSDFATVFDFIDQQARKPVTIDSLSPLAWVGTGKGTYFLGAVGGGYAKIERVGQEDPGKSSLFAKIGLLAQDNILTALFEATFTLPVPTTEDSGYSLRILRKPHKVAESTDLALLFKRMDLAISKQAEFRGRSYDRRASFRSQLSSEGQQAFIAKKIGESSLKGDYFHERNGGEDNARREQRLEEQFNLFDDSLEEIGNDVIPAVWIGHSFASNETVEIKSLTKGQATDIITRLIHGAKGALKTMRKLREKEGLRRLREEKMGRKFRR
jgi:hypothetical protein